MAPSNSSLFLLLLLHIATVSASSSHHAIRHQLNNENKNTKEGVARRGLLSFKEVPRGSNVTFDCSPSGPCVPCLYSEKNDEKYRCSETGYRIPLKCVEIEDSSKNADGKMIPNSRSTLETSVNSKKPHVLLHDAEQLTTSIKHRSLLDDSSAPKGGSQAYITYRSCIPAVNEEKLSVIGFEGIMLGLLLISGSVVYFRRKLSVAMSGVATGRMQAKSRF